jgi:multiple sugar transport system substrate-binding protein
MRNRAGIALLSAGVLTAASGTAVLSQSPAASDGGSSGGAVLAPMVPVPAEGAPLTLWNPFTGPDGTFFSGIVDAFNAETPQCAVTVQTQPGAEYISRLEAAAAGGALPHVIAAGYDALPMLAENGIITPIDDLAQTAGLDATQFPQAIWDAGMWRDQRFGIPIDTHPMLMFYDKARFAEAGLDPEAPPTDRESFEAAITAINEKTDADGYQMVASGPGALFLLGIQFASLFYQGGGEWTNADYSEATFNSPAGVQAAEYLAHLVNDLGVPKVESDAEINAFQQRQNAIVWSGVWESTRYLEALGDDLGVAPIPQIFGPGAWGGTHNLAVTSAAEGPARECAYYFIDWFSGHSLDWAAGGQVPARNVVREQVAQTTETEGLLPIIAQVTPIADQVRFLPSIPGGGDLLFVAQGAGEAATLVVNGSASAQQALDDAAAFNTEVLRQNKERYGF